MSAEVSPDMTQLRAAVGLEYWPNPEGFVPEPVRNIDIARYTSAVQDRRDWRDGDGAQTAPPGFMEVASPNYLTYYSKGGEEFLEHLLPFESPWGPSWKPMMLIRGEHWEVDRPVRAGELIYGTSTISDVTWQDASNGRPGMLGVEFTKVYRNETKRRLGTVTWDMVFVEHALTDLQRDGAAATAPSDEPAHRGGRLPEVDDPIGQYSRLFDMEALVRWSAAIWDLGLPHVDPDYARQVYGLPHAVAHGPFVNASLARVVSDWMDPGDRIIGHRGRFRRPVVGNDLLTFTGTVASVETGTPGDTGLIHVVATNQYGQLVAESDTRCALAS